MADKISTLTLTVDLESGRCYKKIQKVIAKFPEIQSQIFDEKNNKVIISGPFDPEKLKRKLCCKASKYIISIDIQIKPPPPPVPVLVPVILVPYVPCCRYERRTCSIEFFSEEDPSCSIM